MSVNMDLDEKESNYNQLPKGWLWVRLGEIAEQINPGFPSGKHNKENIGIPHLRPMNINVRGEIDLSNTKYVQCDSCDSLRKNDVLFNNTNSPDLLGKTARIKEDTNWSYSNHMTRIRLNNNLLNSAWIAYSLHNLFLSGFFKSNCTHHVNQASINTSFLAEKVFIPLPPLPEQHRIVAKIEELFTKLDAGVEALRKVRAELKRYRQAVLKYAFEGKLTADWRAAHQDELEPASVLLDRIKAERKARQGEKYREPPPVDTSDLSACATDAAGRPELPDGWAWTQVGQIYEIVGGGTPSTNNVEYWKGDIPWITSADIYGLKDIRPRRKINEKAIKNSATNLVPAGSLIVVTRVGLGKVAQTSRPLTFSQDSQALVGNNDLINPDYSLYYLSQAVQIFKYKHRGTTIAGVTKKQLSELVFALPPLLEQHKIVEEIERHFSIADEVEKSVEQGLKQAERLRQSILKKAFNGELTAKWREEHLDELEPAEKLLERIKAEKVKLESKKKNGKHFVKNWFKEAGDV